jgi:hypothetical protein
MLRSRLVAVSLVSSACADGPGSTPGPSPIDAAIADAAPEPDASAPADASVDAHPPDAYRPDADPCASPLVERWTGAATREQGFGYPDRIRADVTWQRVASDGCVDRYQPAGIATYGYAIPGALCQQWIEPESHDIAPGDGSLVVDRSAAPASYTGRGATFWPLVWYCELDDGTIETITLDGGGATWFEASGRVDGGLIGGTYEVSSDDPGAAERCGPNGIPPCIYTWSFTAE